MALVTDAVQMLNTIIIPWNIQVHGDLITDSIISLSGSNSDIFITPDGTGDVVIGGGNLDMNNLDIINAGDIAGYVPNVSPTTDGNIPELDANGRLEDSGYPSVWLDEFDKIRQATSEPTGFEDISESALSFTDGTRTLSIAPTGSGFYYWRAGKRTYETSTKQIVISPDEGTHYIYFDSNGDLQETTSFDEDLILRNNVYVAYVYWDATNSEHIILGDERHGLMPWMVHALWHRTFGTALISGGGLSNLSADGDGSLDSHAEYTVSATNIRDEDIDFSLAQKNSTLLNVYYRSGVNGDWRDVSGPVHHSGGTPYWNEFSGGSWGLSSVGGNDYFLMHVVALNDRSREYGVIMGQNSYNTKNDAREGANTELSSLVLSGLPSEEFAFLGTIIYQHKSSFSNTYGAAVVTTEEGEDYVDWREDDIGPGTGPTNHADLANRSAVGSHPASAISVDTTNFSGFLSSTDTDLLTALETLDSYGVGTESVTIDIPDASGTTHSLVFSDGILTGYSTAAT